MNLTLLKVNLRIVPRISHYSGSKIMIHFIFIKDFACNSESHIILDTIQSPPSPESIVYLNSKNLPKDGHLKHG